MKRTAIIITVLFSLLLVACQSTGQPAAQGTGDSLLVSGGGNEKTYTRANLEVLPSSQATFSDVTYLGVSVSTLLKDAGFDSQEVKALKAVASDGYTVNYDPSQFLGANVIVAYARPDGELANDDGVFRMVLPGAEGKLNLRKLVQLQVIQ